MRNGEKGGREKIFHTKIHTAQSKGKPAQIKKKSGFKYSLISPHLKISFFSWFSGFFCKYFLIFFFFLIEDFEKEKERGIKRGRAWRERKGRKKKKKKKERRERKEELADREPEDAKCRMGFSVFFCPSFFTFFFFIF